MQGAHLVLFVLLLGPRNCAPTPLSLQRNLLVNPR
jgi:hypothetical protein